MVTDFEFADTLKELGVFLPHGEAVRILADVCAQGIQRAVRVEGFVGVVVLEDFIRRYFLADFLRVGFPDSSFKVGDIIAERIVGALLYPQGDMHMIGHNAIGIHGDDGEIIGEMMDGIGNRSSEKAPFHIGTAVEAGSNLGIADYLAERF